MTKKVYKNKAYYVSTYSLSELEDKFMRENKISATQIIKSHLQDMMKIRETTKKEVEALTEQVRIFKIALSMVREKFQDGVYPDLDNWALGLLNEAQIRYNQQKKEGYYDE